MNKREKQYKTKSGYVLTEDVLEKIGEDCEKGIYPEKWDTTVKRKKKPVLNIFGKSLRRRWRAKLVLKGVN